MKRKANYKNTVLGILVVITIISVIGFTAQNEKEALAYQKDILIANLSSDNQALKDKLEASAKIETPETIKELARFYIKKYFGKDADKVEKVMKCESGLNNLTVHINKPGLGVDRGLYQINDRWHKARFEKMYGVSFEIGAHDLDLASQYAKYLYDAQGLTPWICSRIVSKNI